MQNNNGYLNGNLNNAKTAKKDEFYTLYSYIEEELIHYKDHFKDKVVYCNCDDYRHSQFVKFFINNFEGFQLRRLVATAYNPEGGGLMYLFDGINPQVSVIEGDGSYRSEACMSLLREADIVVTNPPFSIFS